MLTSILGFFDSNGLMPHGMCLLWRQDIFWTHVVADSFIALAYFSIPVAVITFARRRKDLPHNWILYLFGAFIIWCGITHVISIVTLWSPQYGAEAAAKVVTAVVSMITAVMVWPLIPKALKIPSFEELRAKNAMLEREVRDRVAAERALQDLAASLERRVEERTQALSESNERLEREIERRKASEKQLLAAIVEAESASRAKSSFLAGMSHELRTPLNSILGFTQLLKNSPARGMTSQEREYVQNIYISGSLLLDLIDRLLDLSKAESGETDVKLEPTDVAMCLEKARAVLEPMAKQAGIKLSIDPGAFEGMTVVADPTRLTQIFINLGTNAIKYNKPGGRVDVRLGTTSLRDLVVSFIDTGIGIPMMYRSQVFQAFNRLHQSKSGVPGAGIGLALSRRFAEAMGAILSFDSAEEAGSSFDIKLQRC